MCAAGYEAEDEETLDRKMRNMKKTYKNIKDNKNSTGRGRIQWEYYDEFEEIFSNDRTVNCGPTISSFASGVQAGSSFASEVQAGSSSASEVQAGSSFASEVQAGSSFGSEVQAVSSFSSEVGAPSSLRIDVGASSVPSPDTARVVSPKRRTSLHLMRKKMLLNEEHKKKLMEGIHKTLKESNKLLKERNDLIRQLLNVLRHEEFTEGCDAQCNGPYDNRWSKTMVGYGPESTHFAIELTYNYGVKSYELGNDFGGLVIQSKEIIERAKKNNYPIVNDGKHFILKAPDGYTFYILNDSQPTDSDPIHKVILHSTDISGSKQFWHNLLKMNLIEQSEKCLTLSYGHKQVSLEIRQIEEPLNRATAYGRIAFALPYDEQPEIDGAAKKESITILTPLISLNTPGKATVRVIILADPDGHEICFVDEEGFSQLSEVDSKGNELLDKYIQKDPFQTN